MIEGLSSLEQFAVGGPNFQDKDFDAIATSHDLISLTIAYSGMTSTGFKGIGRFGNLETLIVSGSDIDDSTIREWEPLQKLRVLMLDRTKITEESSDWLLGLKTLQHLSIDAQVLSKLSDDQLSELSGLQSISIHGNSVSQAMISAMANWKQLSMARFDGSTLDVDMLKGLAGILSIQTFDFFQCNVSPDGMMAFVDEHPSYYSMSLVGTTVPETLKSTLKGRGRLSEYSNQYWWNPQQAPNNFIARCHCDGERSRYDSELSQLSQLRK